MIVLDTNAVSEALKPSPSRMVLDWLAAQDPREVFITTITQAEVLYGIERLPSGKRRVSLLAEIERMFVEDFPGRILPFDEGSARMYAKILRQREEIGRPTSEPDAMIAAIARSQNATLATRNTRDFEGCGVRVINPWVKE
jgi:toxin FitB